MSIWRVLKDFIKPNKNASVSTAQTSIESVSYPQTTLAIQTMPSRTDELVSGSQFMQSILQVGGTTRDALTYDQCLQGNLPYWMRNFKAITFQDAKNTLTYYAAPDYLCIGNDEDFVRVAMGGSEAKRVCDLFGCMMPTKKMVDQIWKAADLKLMPKTMGASYYMSSTQTVWDHHNNIEKQRAGKNFELIAGIKKDTVLAKHLLTDHSRIAIYGWQYLDGTAIQGPMPNSTSHSVDYCDYSQGVRLVSQRAILNGNSVNMFDVLNNSQTAYMISEEGAYNAKSIYL